MNERTIRSLVFEFLLFYGAVNRPMSFFDIYRYLKRKTVEWNISQIYAVLNSLLSEGVIRTHEGLYSVSHLTHETLPRRSQDVCGDKKWMIFMRYSRVFRFIPFLGAACAAGSMSLGNVHEGSDFDTYIVAQEKRMFTMRFFLILLTGMLGSRRSGHHKKEEGSNKLCFNHFVTAKSLLLKPSYNMYWQELYAHFVPLYGDKKIIEQLREINAWTKAMKYTDDRRYGGDAKNIICRVVEYLLHGVMGDFFEMVLKKIQLYKINTSVLCAEYEPRIRVSDDELEFHPDTRRIKEWMKKITSSAALIQ